MRGSRREPGANCDRGGCRAGRHVELAENVGDVAMDRVLAHDEALCDRSIREPLGEEGEHLALALRELAERSGDVRGEHPSRSLRLRFRAELGESVECCAGLAMGRLHPVQRDEACGELDPRRSSLVRCAASLVAVDGVLEQLSRAVMVAACRRQGALGTVGCRPEGRCAEELRGRTELLERGACLFELPARDARVDEQLESGRSLDPTCVRELAQQALHQVDGPTRVASIESEAGAAEPCLADQAGFVEELRCVGRTSLPTSQLRELEKWRSGPCRAGATEVVRRGRQLGLGVRPPATPQLDRPVVGPTEGQHVAAAVPLGELGDSVDPFDRPHVVVHRRARRHEDAEGPGVGDRDRRFVLEGNGGCLVETAHSLVHLTGRDQRRTVESETEHLEVLDLETAPELDRGGG